MTPRIAVMRHDLEAYRQAKRVLASNHTSVAERKEAIDARNEFVSVAPSYVAELVAGIDWLVSLTDGEECADPESCGHARGNPVWLCSRCRLRVEFGGVE